MLDFTAKMHQIQFRHWGSLQRSPDLAGLRGATSKGRGGGRVGERKEREGRYRGWEGRERKERRGKG